MSWARAWGLSPGLWLLGLQALSPRLGIIAVDPRTGFHRASIARGRLKNLAPMAAAAASLSSVTTWA
jgi:hypothetical protein